jgi:hypothetical protein
MSKVIRAVSLVALSTAFSASISSAAMITLNSLNNNVTATVSANDGAGDSISSDDVYVSQFNMTYTSDSDMQSTFNTFCLDLFHSAAVGQEYDVTLRTDLATAFTNGSRIAQIFQDYGTQDLTSDPDQAAAVQIAIWDLSLNNHDPISFEMDSDGTYSSGDESVFSVSLNSNPDTATIAGLVNSYLAGSVGADNQGSWLDASINGDGVNRGQSVLVPSVPEPSALALLLAVGGGLSARRRRA